MTFFQAAVVLTTLLCSLVAGFLFAFAAVVMPGLRRLDDAAFLRGFQAIDGVIQDNQPAFIVVWVGACLALIAAAALAFTRLDGVDRGLLVGAAAIFLLGVQAPTIAINLPLNNRLKQLDVSDLGPAECRRERQAFEAPWNRSNLVRTILACATTLLLALVLVRL